MTEETCGYPHAGAPGLRHQRVPRDEDAAIPGEGAEAQGDPGGVEAPSATARLSFWDHYTIWLSVKPQRLALH